MAIGDAAAAAGLEVVPSSQDLRLGFERINQKGDELAALMTLIGGALAPGTSIEGHWTTAPAGYSLEDGGLLNRIDQPALFAVIGTRYNTGGESTAQFRKPNSQGRTTVAKAATGLFNVLGSTTGAETVTLGAGQIPNHTHQYAWGTGTVNQGTTFPVMIPTGFDTTTSTAGVFEGSGGAHTNVQPSIVLNRAIRL